MNEDDIKEDEELIRRITNAPDRYVFRIPVSGSSNGGAEEMIRKTKDRLKSLKMSNPLNSDEDGFTQS